MAKNVLDQLKDFLAGGVKTVLGVTPIGQAYNAYQQAKTALPQAISYFNPTSSQKGFEVPVQQFTPNVVQPKLTQLSAYKAPTLQTIGTDFLNKGNEVAGNILKSPAYQNVVQPFLNVGTQALTGGANALLSPQLRTDISQNLRKAVGWKPLTPGQLKTLEPPSPKGTAETGAYYTGAGLSVLSQFYLAGKLTSFLGNFLGRSTLFSKLPSEAVAGLKAWEAAGGGKIVADFSPAIHGAIQWGMVALPHLQSPTVEGKIQELAVNMVTGGAFGKISLIPGWGPVQKYLANIIAPTLIKATLGTDPKQAVQDAKFYAVAGLPFLMLGGLRKVPPWATEEGILPETMPMKELTTAEGGLVSLNPKIANLQRQIENLFPQRAAAELRSNIVLVKEIDAKIAQLTEDMNKVVKEIQGGAKIAEIPSGPVSPPVVQPPIQPVVENPPVPQQTVSVTPPAPIIKPTPALEPVVPITTPPIQEQTISPPATPPVAPVATNVVPPLTKTKTGFQFYSPNEENLTFNQAQKNLTSERQAWFKSVTDDIDKSLKMNSQSFSAIGDWSDGAENTIFNKITKPKNYEELRYSAALKGKIGNQKAVIPFMSDSKGKQRLYEVDIKTGNVLSLRQALDQSGLKFRTIVPTQEGYKVLIYDPENTLLSNLEQLGEQYGITYNIYKGKGEFLGSDTSRAEGLQFYNKIISDYETKVGQRRDQGERGSGIPAIQRPNEGAPIQEAAVPTPVEPATQPVAEPAVVQPEPPAVSLPETPVEAVTTPPPEVPPTPPSTTGEALPKYAEVNLNLDRLNTGEDVKKFILDWSEKNKEILNAEYDRFDKTNFINNLRKMSLDTGIDLDEVLDKKKYNLSTPKGQKDLFKDVFILRNANIVNYEQAVKINTQIGQTTDPIVRKSLEAKYLELTSQITAVRFAVQNKTRLAGQFLNFYKEMARAINIESPGEKLLQVEKVLRKNFNLTEDQLDRAMKGAIETNLNDPNAVINFLKDIAILSGNKQSLLWELFYNNLLSSLRTQEANFIGNTLSLIVNESLRIPATVMEQGWAKLQGRTPELNFQEIIPSYIGLIRGFGKGIEKGAQIMKTGFDPDEILNPSKWANVRMEAWSVHPSAHIRRWAPVINFWMRAMKTSDAVTKSILYEAQASSLAIRQAMEGGGKTSEEIAQKSAEILQNLSEHRDIMENAQNYARTATFNQAPDRLAKLLIRARETKIAGTTPLKAIIPFISIASNLLRQSLKDFSPAGFITPVNSEAWGNKGYEKAARSFAYLRAFLGTMLMLWGASKFIKGEITLEAPTNPADVDRFYNVEKKIPWSIAIELGGTKHWVSIRRLEPFVNPFLNGAIIAKNIDQWGKRGTALTDLITNLVQQEGKFILDTGYFQGIQNFFDAFSGGYFATNAYQRFIGSIISGFVTPNFLRDIAHWYDPYLKEPKNIDEYVLQSMPIISKTVQNRLSAFGEPIERSGNPFLFMSSSQEAQDKLAKELVRLDKSISFVQDTISGLKLTDEQHQEYQRVAGQLTKEYLTEFVNSLDYDQLDDASKETYIDKLTGYARETARTMFLDKYMNQDSVKKIEEIYTNILPMDDKKQSSYINALLKEGAITEDELQQLTALIEEKAPGQKESLLQKIQKAINPQAGAIEGLEEIPSVTLPITGTTAGYSKLKFPTLDQLKEQRDIGGTSIIPPKVQPVKSYNDFASQFLTFTDIFNTMQNKVDNIQTQDLALDIKKKYMDIYNQRIKDMLTTRLEMVQGNAEMFKQFLATDEGEAWYKKEATAWYKVNGLKVPKNLTLGLSPLAQTQAQTRATSKYKVTPKAFTAKGYKAPTTKITLPKLKIKTTAKPPSTKVYGKLKTTAPKLVKMAKINVTMPKLTKYISGKKTSSQTGGILAKGRRIA